VASLTPVTPASELIEELGGVACPDPDFADDLEDVIREMRSQLPRDMEEDLMGIWQGSDPESEVAKFLEWRRSEGQRENKELEQS
jgi:hypothetical protein